MPGADPDRDRQAPVLVIRRKPGGELHKLREGLAGDDELKVLFAAGRLFPERQPPAVDRYER